MPAYDPNNPTVLDHLFPDQGGDKIYLDHVVRNWDKSSLCIKSCQNEAESGIVRRVGDDLELTLNKSINVKNYLYNIDVVICDIFVCRRVNCDILQCLLNRR